MIKTGKTFTQAEIDQLEREGKFHYIDITKLPILTMEDILKAKKLNIDPSWKDHAS